MLVGIHQLHYLPWLRYFEKIARSDVFVALDNVQFTKNGWQNRNKIRTAEGTAVLSVPVRASLGQSLDEIRINDDTRWRRKHWRSIEQHYRNAPYFEDHAPFLRETYERAWEKLNDLNRHMLGYFVDALGVTTRIDYASELDVPGAATDRLVNLVRAVGGRRYYSGAFAIEAYLDVRLFEAAEIGIELQQWESRRYPQQYDPFVPDLSIIDLLFNCGPESRDVLLGEATPRGNPHDSA